MIEVIRQGENYIPPGFEKDLKLISRNLLTFWDPRYERYLVISPAPFNTFRNGYIVEYLVEKNGEFAPLDNRVLEALRRARYEKLRFRSLDDFLVQIDKEDREKREKALKLSLEMKSDFYKKWNKLSTTKTFT